MSWEKITFGELYKSPTRNGIYKEKSNHGYGVKIVNMGEIFAYDFIGSQDMQRIELTENELQNFRLEENDLLFARRSLVESGAGKASIVANLVEPTTFESSIIRVRLNAEICCPLFYLYWLRSLAGRAAISALVTGVNVKGIRGSELKDIKVDYPPIEIQRKISGILKEYDNLIENNQKQIKLLEEAAQRLYKEWFVDLRFPGYENTPIIDGVPQGWKRERLVDIADVQYGFAFDGSLFNSDGNGMPIIRIRNIPDGTTKDYTTEEADEQYIVKNGDIVVGMDGEFHINSWSGEDSYLVQRTCRIKPHNSDMNGYLLQAIYEPIKFFESTVVGATVAHLGKKHIDTITVLTAPEEMYKPFQQYFNKRQLLLNQNQRLAEARDRLLPKLMSGELEV